MQVTVQTASGPLQLGEAAASVQFSRSIGAAFGTAVVAAVLFSVLSLKNPEAARLFAAMAEYGGHRGVLPPAQAALQADLAEAFRVALFAVAAFASAGFLLALAIPLRRI